MVARVADPSPERGRAALAELFQSYWKPVYHYIRIAWTKTNEDAKDLTQAFFLWLLEDGGLQRYTPERASFRTYLKSLLKHFLQDQDKAAHRQKRGGQVQFLNLDDDQAPLRGVLPDPRATDPEKAFDHAWKSTLIARAVDRVRHRFLAPGKAIRFRVFEEYSLAPPKERPSYAALAERLGLTEDDVRNYLFAIREEVRSEIRAELSEITTGPEELEEEWNALFGT